MIEGCESLKQISDLSSLIRSQMSRVLLGLGNDPLCSLPSFPASVKLCQNLVTQPGKPGPGRRSCRIISPNVSKCLDEDLLDNIFSVSFILRLPPSVGQRRGGTKREREGGGVGAAAPDAGMLAEARTPSRTRRVAVGAKRRSLTVPAAEAIGVRPSQRSRPRPEFGSPGPGVGVRCCRR